MRSRWGCVPRPRRGHSLQKDAERGRETRSKEHGDEEEETEDPEKHHATHQSGKRVASSVPVATTVVTVVVVMVMVVVPAPVPTGPTSTGERAQARPRDPAGAGRAPGHGRKGVGRTPGRERRGVGPATRGATAACRTTASGGSAPGGAPEGLASAPRGTPEGLAATATPPGTSAKASASAGGPSASGATAPRTAGSPTHENLHGRVRRPVCGTYIDTSGRSERMGTRGRPSTTSGQQCNRTVVRSVIVSGALVKSGPLTLEGRRAGSARLPRGPGRPE